MWGAGRTGLPHAVSGAAGRPVGAGRARCGTRRLPARAGEMLGGLFTPQESPSRVSC
jgi:hypothetical protein